MTRCYRFTAYKYLPGGLCRGWFFAFFEGKDPLEKYITFHRKYAR
jgi:hypothetical protein